MKSESKLEQILTKGEFAVTSECGPPRGADAEVIKKKGEVLKGFVDGVNVTDNQTSVVRMSSISSCVILKGLGLNFLGGEELKGSPRMFIGAAENPFADPFEIRVHRLAKKIAAGVDFIQTQCIYNLEKFEKWMKMVRDRGLHERVHILGGVTPFKSVGMANYMKKSVPGMDVPDELIERMKAAPKEKKAEEGINICIETIQRLREIEGIHGVHIMAIEWEEMVPEIVKRAGLFPRPHIEG